jgi:hypothetical protein
VARSFAISFLTSDSSASPDCFLSILFGITTHDGTAVRSKAVHFRTVPVFLMACQRMAQEWLLPLSTWEVRRPASYHLQSESNAFWGRNCAEWKWSRQCSPAETSARLTMVELLQAILGSNLSDGGHSARSERPVLDNRYVINNIIYTLRYYRGTDSTMNPIN